MNKKRIAFFIYDLHCGGVEKSLIDLLKKFDYNKYRVDLIVFFEKGQFFSELPPQVNVIKYDLDAYVSMHINGHVKRDIISLLKQGKILRFLTCVCRMGIERIFFNKKRWEFVHKVFLKKSKPLPEYYDVAIDYQGLGSSILGMPMIVEKINSKVKLTWIHQDVKYISAESKRFSRYLNHFDKVFCVSFSAKDAFLSEFPEYHEKTDVLYNVIDRNSIVALSEEPGCYAEKDRLTILSVGRLDYQKGYDVAIRALAMIKDKLPPFVYKIIGGGDAVLAELQTLINDLDMNNYVELMGRKGNPYPYYKNADIYLQPSRFEGFCITLGEAKIFNLPIVTTDFAGAREQIVNMETGIITECTEEEIAESLLQLIGSKSMQEKFATNLARTAQLESELHKLYDAFDS